MRKAILLISLLSIISCRYFNVSPVNGITIKNLDEKPLKDEMVGIWEIDDQSYNLIEYKGYEKKPVKLKLNGDGTFQIINLPSFVNVFDKVENDFTNTSGNWSLEQSYKDDKWILKMKYAKSNLHKEETWISYDLYMKNDKIIIWKVIGDPDSGEYFLFNKVE